MNERVVRRVTTTVVEELDRCAPRAVPTPGTSEELSEAIERDGPTCPKPSHDDGGAVAAEVVDLRDDDLVA